MLHLGGRARVVLDEVPGRAARRASTGARVSSEPSTSRTSTDPPRLNVQPDASATGFVDGAWWPRSRDFAAELPSVVAELSTLLGPVERVAYNLDAWPTTPYKIRIGGAVVRMGGFHSLDADIVEMIGAHRRLVLLVVPPETEQQAALAALDAAAQVGNAEDVEALLHPGSQGETVRTK